MTASLGNKQWKKASPEPLSLRYTNKHAINRQHGCRILDFMYTDNPITILITLYKQAVGGGRRNMLPPPAS